MRGTGAGYSRSRCGIQLGDPEESDLSGVNSAGARNCCRGSRLLAYRQDSPLDTPRKRGGVDGGPSILRSMKFYSASIRAIRHCVCSATSKCDGTCRRSFEIGTLAAHAGRNSVRTTSRFSDRSRSSPRPGAHIGSQEILPAKDANSAKAAAATGVLLSNIFICSSRNSNGRRQEEGNRAPLGNNGRGKRADAIRERSGQPLAVAGEESEKNPRARAVARRGRSRVDGKLSGFSRVSDTEGEREREREKESPPDRIPRDRRDRAARYSIILTWKFRATLASRYGISRVSPILRKHLIAWYPRPTTPGGQVCRVEVFIRPPRPAAC